MMAFTKNNMELIWGKKTFRVQGLGFRVQGSGFRAFTKNNMEFIEEKNIEKTCHHEELHATHLGARVLV